MSNGLEVDIKDGAITIRLPLDTLDMVVSCCPDLGSPDDVFSPTVTDAETFAREVLTELSREEEDGTTLVHEMFDKALVRAIENGADGVLMPEDARPFPGARTTTGETR